MDKLKGIGLSEGLLKRIKSLSLNGSINRVESYEEPDFIEWSLLSGLCLLNNEAMFAQNVLPIERSTVERLQVRFYHSPLHVHNWSFLGIAADYSENEN